MLVIIYSVPANMQGRNYFSAETIGWERIVGVAFIVIDGVFLAQSGNSDQAGGVVISSQRCYHSEISLPAVAVDVAYLWTL